MNATAEASGNELAGLAAIVTGATRGIGRAVSVALARMRVSIGLVARDPAGLAETKRLVESLGAPAFELPCDLADASATAQVVARAVDVFGRLDILVNNAGLACSSPLVETSTELFDQLMALNARAPFILCRDAIPYLKQSPRASIVNILSVVSHKGYRHQGAYAASKHALLGITKVLANEVHADDIRVHAVSPGGVATSLVTATRPDLDLDVLMQPEDIADIVLYLLIHRSNAVIDEIRVRRAVSEPSF